MALFHARGYDAVGVAELSEAIGIKPPSLYAAFGSKKGLFERALRRYAETAGGFIPATLAEDGSVAQVIGRMLTRAAEIYGAPGALPGCLVLDSARNCSDPEVRRLTETLRNRGRELLYRRIAEEYPEAADVLADYVTVTLAGLSASARDGMAPAALRKAAEMAAKGFAAQLPDEA
ncbi:MAG: TetR family transcriptional regulator [Kiloniellaceae bacterium]|nr:TetR family transcriptional regulator [Kiloniellaceae bacterium]